MGILLKTIRLILMGPCVALVSTIWFIVPFLSPANPKWTSYSANSFGLIGKYLLGYKIDIENEEILKNVDRNIIISNHQSNFDIFYIGQICPRMTVSIGKRDILFFPFFGLMYWMTGNIVIDRSNRKKAWSVMDGVVDRIKEGVNVWIMPEGTRSKGRGLLPFKKGPFVVAIKAKRPIVPVCVGDFYKSIDLSKWNSGTLKIKILEPISTEEETLENINPFIERVRDQMDQEIKKLS